MLDRRTFLTAAVGAATFPMPALAREPLAVVTVAQRALTWRNASGEEQSFGHSPNLALLPNGRLLAAWTHPRPDATQVGWPVYVQSFTKALKPASAQHAIGEGGSVGVVVTAAGGMVAIGTRNARLRPLDSAGMPTGRYRVATSETATYGLYFPAIGPIGADGYLAAWCAAAGTTPRRRGVRAAIFGPDGTRRSAWFWAAGPVEGDESGGFPLGVFPTASGAVVVSAVYDGTERAFVWRSVASNGSLGKPLSTDPVATNRLVNSGVAFAAVGSMIVGVWGEGAETLGGVFGIDGRLLRALEAVETPAGSTASAAMTARAIVPLTGNRLYSPVAGSVWDAATGKPLSRPAWPTRPGTIQAVVPLGGTRFAAAFQPEGEPRCSIEVLDVR